MDVTHPLIFLTNDVTSPTNVKLLCGNFPAIKKHTYLNSSHILINSKG